MAQVERAQGGTLTQDAVKTVEFTRAQPTVTIWNTHATDSIYFTVGLGAPNPAIDGVNAVWTIDRDGASSGTWSLTVCGILVGAALAWNVSVGSMNTALDSALGASQVVCSAGTGDDLVLTFSGANYAKVDVGDTAVVVVDNTDADVAAAETTPGHSLESYIVPAKEYREVWGPVQAVKLLSHGTATTYHVDARPVS